MTSSIVLLTANTAPTAPSGFRTVVFWWKTSKTTGKMLSPKKYAHIPVITIPGQMDDKSQMSIFLRNSVEDAQDQFLKGLIESSLDKKEFSDIELTLTSVMNDYFSSKNTGGRLDGQMIEDWFISDMMEILQVAVERKVGSDDIEKVASIVIGYQEKYKKLASGAVKYPRIVAQNLLDNLNKVTTESDVKQKLIKRLTPMTVEVTAESEGLI